MSWRFVSEYPKSITENVELAAVVLDNRKQIVNSPTTSGFENSNTTPSPRSSPTFTPFWFTTTPFELKEKKIWKFENGKNNKQHTDDFPIGKTQEEEYKEHWTNSDVNEFKKLICSITKYSENQPYKW